jgi:hypothetical protein
MEWKKFPWSTETRRFLFKEFGIGRKNTGRTVIDRLVKNRFGVVFNIVVRIAFPRGIRNSL